MTLTYALTGGGRELVAIDGRRVRYLMLQGAHPAWQSHAGLFAGELPATLAEQAVAIAGDLVATPVRSRQRSGPVVTASVDGRQVTTALTEPTEPAAVLLSEVIEVVRELPVAVVGLAAEMINDSDLRLAFTAIGSESVDLQLHRESCRVSALVDGGWQTLWSAAAADARLTLVAPPTGFVDGVRSPAVLPPGTVARTMVPGALGSMAGRAERVVVDLDATLELPGTEDLVDAEPALTTDPRGRWPVHLTARA